MSTLPRWLVVLKADGIAHGAIGPRGDSLALVTLCGASVTFRDLEYASRVSYWYALGCRVCKETKRYQANRRLGGKKP